MKHLARLFRYVEALRIFNYDHFRTRETPGEDYGSAVLISALCLYAEKTLTFLKYTSDADDEIGDSRTPCASGLCRFETLKTLRISRVALIVKRRPQRLVDELPSSLEQLELVDPISTMEAEQMLKDLLARKQERLPNLRLLVYEGAVPFDDEAIAACEREGLERRGHE